MTDTDQLRQRIAEALMRWAEGNNSPQYASMRRPETVRQNANGRAAAVLAELKPELDLLAELSEARQHGAYTYCDHLVGHVNVAEFARKISEKRTALGQREEAVQYANEQKQRAEQAEAVIARAREIHRETCPLASGSVKPTAYTCGMCEALDEPAPTAATGFVPFAPPHIPRTGDPENALVVEPYRNDRGEDVWVFRCWGTDSCDGWLSPDHYSRQSAERARDRHVAEEHADA